MSSILNPIPLASECDFAKYGDMEDSFLARLNRALDQVGLTREQAADLVPMPLQTLSKWGLSGRTPESIIRAVRLAKALGVTVEWLFAIEADIETVEPVKPTREAVLGMLYDALGEEGVDRIVNALTGGRRE